MESLMPTAAFTTLGCKVNQYETQKILESFEAAGYDVVPFDSAADVYVVNSCSVTSDAESKSRYVVRRARRANPIGRVVVTGCAAQTALNKQEVFDGADVVVPNPDKLDTLKWFHRAFPAKELLPAHAKPDTMGGRARATLKVQDGCDVMCSYCSIPFTRPGMVSRPSNEVLAEARDLAERGYGEAVLTGVLIGAYGPNSGSGGPDFEDLVELLARDSGLPRLRISSIEVHQVTDRLLDLLVEGKVVPHLHVPLQSGDDNVLADMRRRYRKADFLKLCDRIKSRVPDATITTDVMVGFPTESAECFESTLDVCRNVGFLKAHVFRFSPRFGTPADEWGDPVSPEIKKERAQRVAAITEASGAAVAGRYVGRTLDVLFEGKPSRDGLLEGVSRNWLTVRAVGSANLCRTVQRVKTSEVKGSELYGELVSPTALTLDRGADRTSFVG